MVIKVKEKVKINISARHVHLTKETYDLLFNHELTVRNNLNQIGQFAANETVTIKTNKGEFNNVRIIGPLRKYNQVEISMSDARKLGLKPPVRKSGHLEQAEEITITTEKGEVTLPCCIIANRHVHLSPDDAKRLNIKDDEPLKLVIAGEKSGVIDIVAKVSDDGYLLEYAITKASVNDARETIELLVNAQPKNRYLLGDEGYVGKDLHHQLKKMGYILWTPYRKNMKNAKKHNNHYLMALRRTIESDFSLLTYYNAENNRARSLTGFQERLEVAILAYNMAYCLERFN